MSGLMAICEPTPVSAKKVVVGLPSASIAFTEVVSFSLSASPGWLRGADPALDDGAAKVRGESGDVGRVELEAASFAAPTAQRSRTETTELVTQPVVQADETGVDARGGTLAVRDASGNGRVPTLNGGTVTANGPVAPTLP